MRSQTCRSSLVFTGCRCSVNLHGKMNRTYTESFHLFLLLCLSFFCFVFFVLSKNKNHSKNFLIIFFISTCLKWDTGWTLVSQNNEILFVWFCLGIERVSWGPSGWWSKRKKEKENPIISILNSCQYNFQRFVVWCTELACCFVISHICALISFKQ